MKFEMRNQLIWIILGTAIALALPLLPGVPDKARMWLMLAGIIVVFRIFKMPFVAKLFSKRKSGE